jgi:hypothetical protein
VFSQSDFPATPPFDYRPEDRINPIEPTSLNQPRDRVSHSARSKPPQRTIMFARMIDDVSPVDRAGAFALALRRTKLARMAYADILRELRWKLH